MRPGRFLSVPYGAYHQAAVPPIDPDLQRVGPGTPGGEYLRRFWHPVVHAAALRELPVAIRILGEDLVAFRDGQGRVGVLERHCAHRGTSLEFGKVERDGLRCCYHGWLYAVDGSLVEAPAEPAANPYVGKLCQGAYPAVEYAGLVFVYMGPPETRPPFSTFDLFDQPGIALGRGEQDPRGNVKPCNWLQVMDNVADQVHEPFLHARISGIQFTDENGRAVTELLDLGEPAWFETPIGILCQEARRVGDSVWVRSMEYICPNVALVCDTPVLPAVFPRGADEVTSMPLLCRWRVPVDDEVTTEFAYIFHPEGTPNRYITETTAARRSNQGDRPYEERQRFPGDYDAQVGQRAIARHGAEHLASTDKGVALLRKMVRDGIEAAAAGRDPKGVWREDRPVPTHAHETIVRAPKQNDAAAERRLLHAAMRAVFERSSKLSPTAQLKQGRALPLQLDVRS